MLYLVNVWIPPRTSVRKNTNLVSAEQRSTGLWALTPLARLEARQNRVWAPGLGDSSG